MLHISEVNITQVNKSGQLDNYSKQEIWDCMQFKGH